MDKNLQLKRWKTSIGHDAYTGTRGEPTVIFSEKTVAIHDGSTKGGAFKLASKEDVDSKANKQHIHNASEITSGVFDPDRLPSATLFEQGAMSPQDKAKLEGLSNPNTDLSVQYSETNLTVNSSTGSSALIEPASETTAGVMSSDDKAKLNSINVYEGTDLSVGGSGEYMTIASSTGDGATLPIASTNNAGLMSPTDKNKLNSFAPDLQLKLDSIEWGAQANIGTDLSVYRDDANYYITSSTGNEVAIQQANEESPGLMISEDKVKLDGIPADTQTQLDGKAASSHTHSISNVSGLQTALDGKVGTGSAQSLHPSNALRISGTTLSLYKGDGSAENVKLGGVGGWLRTRLTDHSLNVNYTNTYGETIIAMVTVSRTTASGVNIRGVVDETTVFINDIGGDSYENGGTVFMVVPPGATYRVVVNGGASALNFWDIYR
ncbi:MAG: hypothetical protein IBX57_00880 [Gammaproteobacteria bacterium]|nr:hypothetical protein [Gammaproteobacteria bacterium]